MEYDRATVRAVMRVDDDATWIDVAQRAIPELVEHTVVIIEMIGGGEKRETSAAQTVEKARHHRVHFPHARKILNHTFDWVVSVRITKMRAPTEIFC